MGISHSSTVITEPNTLPGVHTPFGFTGSILSAAVMSSEEREKLENPSRDYLHMCMQGNVTTYEVIATWCHGDDAKRPLDLQWSVSSNTGSILGTISPKTNETFCLTQFPDASFSLTLCQKDSFWQQFSMPSRFKVDDKSSLFQPTNAAAFFNVKSQASSKACMQADPETLTFQGVDCAQDDQMQYFVTDGSEFITKK